MFSSLPVKIITLLRKWLALRNFQQQRCDIYRLLINTNIAQFVSYAARMCLLIICEADLYSTSEILLIDAYKKDNNIESTVGSIHQYRLPDRFKHSFTTNTGIQPAK